VGRIFNVFPLSAILNCFRSDKIMFKSQLVMCFAGLRGAIAFALAINFTTNDTSLYNTIVASTLIVVFFTTAVFGGGTLPLMKLLKITAADLANSTAAVDQPEAPFQQPMMVKRVWGVGRALLDDVRCCAVFCFGKLTCMGADGHL